MRKPPISDTALMVSNLDPDKDDAGHDQFLGDIVEEAAYITKEETVFLSINDVVFDNGSTVNLIKNSKLLTGISNLQEADAEGVRVDKEGKLGDIGAVYYSKNASANILSMSSLVDSGTDVKYDPKANRFTVQPKGSSKIYCLCRRNIAGNESKFYVCNDHGVIGSDESSAARNDLGCISSSEHGEIHQERSHRSEKIA
jgi:hypothetical protein